MLVTIIMNLMFLDSYKNYKVTLPMSLHHSSVYTMRDTVKVRLGMSEIIVTDVSQNYIVFHLIL